MNSTVTKSMISGLLTGMVWAMAFVVFIFVIVKLMASSGNRSGIDEGFLFRIFIMGGSIFAMGLACGAPAKYYELKKLEDENYKWMRPYLFSSFLSFCLILVMSGLVPTKRGISAFADKPGSAIFLAILLGLCLPFLGVSTVHNIDKMTRRKVE
jgi:archaellum biogenesis protein FlaJ (TadC family)